MKYLTTLDYNDKQNRYILRRAAYELYSNKRLTLDEYLSLITSVTISNENPYIAVQNLNQILQILASNLPSM